MKLKRPPQRFDMVEVWWDDATGMTQGWIDNSELKIIPCIVITVGFLVKETSDFIIIASDIDGHDNHNGRTQIPRGLVKKIKVLKQKDKSLNVVVTTQ